jgi:glutaredoxin
MAPRPVEVLLLTQDDCAYCEQAKDVLERLHADYPLSVDTLELSSPRGRELARQGGILFAPGLLIDGEPFSFGRLSERKLRRELKRRNGTP